MVDSLHLQKGAGETVVPQSLGEHLQGTRVCTTEPGETPTGNTCLYHRAWGNTYREHVFVPQSLGLHLQGTRVCL